MPIKSKLAKLLAHYITKKINRNSQAENAIQIQQKWMQYLIKEAQQTRFGKDHQFAQIKDYKDFKSQIPIKDYEGLRPYIDQIIAGASNVLWKGKPIYFAKTSGTTSGSKYIPITKASISNHINGARNALLAYIFETGNNHFVDGKMIFLSGSPELDQKGGILTGRLSGIVNHHVPSYLRSNQLPSYPTNCIEDWETKLEAIIEETMHQNMTLISGIPPWVQMYFDRLEEHANKKMKALFPNFSLMVHGGVNYQPYADKMRASIGEKIDMIELYPASEGFFAYQNRQDDEGLLLNINSGIFYEFVPREEIFNKVPTRLSLGEVELGVNYAIIINSNAGLWGYNIGDTVKFVSKNPYKIRVTGRIKHFISAFGEHVIGEEVERALQPIAQAEGIRIIEFTVAPKIQTKEELPHHEWFIEFDNLPENLTHFAQKIDHALQAQNTYYADLIEGNILQTLQIKALKKGAFQRYMKSLGKLGGQNKVARLSNDRSIVEQLNKELI